jgi:ATP-dependent Clp protease ATP-binding subunit ClpC
MLHGYHFTESTRRALAAAREEASRLHHNVVGTEHILLGLVREDQGPTVAISVLRNLDIDTDDIIHRVESAVKTDDERSSRPDVAHMSRAKKGLLSWLWITGAFPYTSRARKAFELAMSEARELNHNYVGTEHLLLGLLREEKGIAAQVLTDAGITLDGARAELKRLCS